MYTKAGAVLEGLLINQQKQQKNISKSATAKSANFKDGFLDEKFLFLIIFEINK